MNNLNTVSNLRWSLNKVLLMAFGLALLAREARVLCVLETSCNILAVGFGLAIFGVGLTLLQPKRFSLVGRLAALCFFASLCWFVNGRWNSGNDITLPGIDDIVVVATLGLVSISFVFFGSHPKVITLLEHMCETEDFWDGDWD
jgi:hypothetical protein